MLLAVARPGSVIVPAAAASAVVPRVVAADAQPLENLTTSCSRAGAEYSSSFVVQSAIVSNRKCVARCRHAFTQKCSFSSSSALNRW